MFSRLLVQNPTSAEIRMIAGMRLGLAVSALLAIAIDASEPDHYATLTYTALALYVAYGGVVYILARHPHHSPSQI